MNWSENLEREGRLLIDAARKVPDAAVPACPDFDVRKLVRHLAFVHGRTAVGLAGTTETPFRRDDALPPPPAPEQALDVYPSALAGLLEAFDAAYLGDPTWTMTDPEGTKAFWFRRGTDETTVHRFADVEQAASLPVTPVPVEWPSTASASSSSWRRPAGRTRAASRPRSTCTPPTPTASGSSASDPAG